MPHIHIQKIIYKVRTQYFTLNNVVIAVALLIAVNWMWGALSMMQRNYTLQREVDTKQRHLQLAELQRDSLALEKRYFQTNEYQELAVRESLGLVMPGEGLLLHNPSRKPVSAVQSTTKATSTSTSVEDTSNIEQWLNFLFGGNSQSISG
jgi:cell division protein FtsB